MTQNDNPMGLNVFQRVRLVLRDPEIRSAVPAVVWECAFIDAYGEIKDDLKDVLS